MIIPVLLTACSTPLSILDPTGPAAREAAGLWWGMFVFFSLVLLAVVATWIYAILRRPSAAHQSTDLLDHGTVQEQKQQQTWIIGGGIVLPAVSIVLLLMFGIPAGNRMAGVGLDSQHTLQINITGHQWWWEVTYPDSLITLKDELHIPAGTPVRLSLSSADVIHSFWVPRIGRKLDMIPGRTNDMFFQAGEPGEYHGICAEFCGLAHAQMRFKVYVHTAEDFAVWLASQQVAEAAE